MAKKPAVKVIPFTDLDKDFDPSAIQSNGVVSARDGIRSNSAILAGNYSPRDALKHDSQLPNSDASLQDLVNGGYVSEQDMAHRQPSNALYRQMH